MTRIPVSVSQLLFIKSESVLSECDALNRREHSPRSNTVALR